MKLVRFKLLFFVLIYFSFSTTAMAGNNLLAIAQERINKIAKNNPLRQGFDSQEQTPHKSSLEFKQAVIRYVKHTENHCMNNSARYVDENVAYKKELRYLFKNYGKFSTVSLLSRLRSAHQEMVKHESELESDNYKRYEQISSALLLVCAQVFAHDARNQILNALDEIDNLIIYWRSEQQKVSSIFTRSSKIINNIKKLECKQKELYTILGALTEHVFTFSERSLTYTECYRWIEELFFVLSALPVISNYTDDGTQFDAIAAQLMLKIKRVGSLKNECLTSVFSAGKPNHFVRHWLAYTIGLAGTGYLAHYHVHNPGVLSDAAIKTAQFFEGIVKSVVIDPMTDLYQVFFKIDSKSAVTNIENRVMKIEELAKNVESNVAKLTAEDAISLRKYAETILKSTLNRMVEAERWNGLTADHRDIILQDVAKNDLTTLNAFCEKTSFYYYDDRLDMEEVRILLVVDKLLKILQDYPELIDKSILPLIKEVGFLIVDSGNIVGDFVKNNYWTAKLVAFTPLAAACIGSVKAYRWAIKKDYAPIRIALADVNALLIESATHFDNYHYGKLVYLICKLRHKASTLKDPLAHEFLIDVAKLESKRYLPDVKRDMVENMFNKYAFLGRITA